jgi:hypothetical protein
MVSLWLCNLPTSIYIRLLHIYYLYIVCLTTQSVARITACRMVRWFVNNDTECVWAENISTQSEVAIWREKLKKNKKKLIEDSRSAGCISRRRLSSNCETPKIFFPIKARLFWKKKTSNWPVPDAYILQNSVNLLKPSGYYTYHRL